MQQDFPIPPPRHRPTRLIKYPHLKPDEEKAAHSSAARDVEEQQTVLMQPVEKTPNPVYDLGRSTGRPFSNSSFDGLALADIESLEDISEQSTLHLMQLSGMMPVISRPQLTNAPRSQAPASMYGIGDSEDGWWPNGIQQTGPIPVINLYGNEPFGLVVPYTPMPEEIAFPKKQPAWKALLGSPAFKVTFGLTVGIGLLLLVMRIVNIQTTFQVLQQNLATPRGILFALLSGVAFLSAFSIRGLRWKLFLNPIGKVKASQSVRLFLVSIFLNFLLPIQGGEVAKTMMLKRIAGIPISKSLPTIAMDRSLDLMPALFIMVIVPILGVQMDSKLWIVLAFVACLLIGLIFFISLSIWKRTAAIGLLQKFTRFMPTSIGSKIEGFATGFVDALLAGASQPKIFIPAMLLTCVAVCCDGLFAMLAFWTIGYPISFGAAIFGYTVYNMFFILPNPPGQIGSNEAIGLLVFSGLLHLPGDKVTAMFVFSHPWAALLMTTAGLTCLKSLGLTVSSAMKAQPVEESAKLPAQKQSPRRQPAHV